MLLYINRVYIQQFISSIIDTSTCFNFLFSFCRSFLGKAGPATWPDANRVMECLITKLCATFPDHVRKPGQKLIMRWTVIINAYKNIRSKALANALVTTNTQLQLIEIANGP